MEDAIRFALEQRTWAVVGCSPSPSRDSHRIAALLQRRGHTIVPINPSCDEVLGERAYARLADVPEPVARPSAPGRPASRS
jgi:predicted CoA-binding protein